MINVIKLYGMVINKYKKKQKKNDKWYNMSWFDAFDKV